MNRFGMYELPQWPYIERGAAYGVERRFAGPIYNQSLKLPYNMFEQAETEAMAQAYAEDL